MQRRPIGEIERRDCNQPEVFSQGIAATGETPKSPCSLTAAPDHVKMVGEQGLSMTVGLLTVHARLPGCASLKEKRSLIKPLLTRLHREFNISTAEDGLNDHWQQTIILCALAANDAAYAQKALQAVLSFIEEHYPNFEIIDHSIEIV